MIVTHEGVIMNYAEARETARPLFHSLMPLSRSIQAVGDLRLQADEISSIGFLLIPKVHIEVIVETMLAWGTTLTLSSDKIVRVAFPNRLGVTVWLGSSDVFGTELLVRTGPEDFVDGLFERLSKNGISVNRDTFMASNKKNEPLPVPSESHIFGMAGLGLVVPPELRYDFDVIDAQ